MLFKLCIVYASYLLFPLIGLSAYVYLRASSLSKRVLWFLLIFVLLLGVYVRFIEPRVIVVRHEVLPLSESSAQLGDDQIRIVLIADMHLGVYKGKTFLRRVVNKIKKQQPDLVLIAGDFLYELDADDIASWYASLADLSVPVYAVTGNHDAEHPGNVPSSVVRDALESLGVECIDNQMETVFVGDTRLRVYGLSDLWEGKMNVDVLRSIEPHDLSVVLVHNPDSVSHFPNHVADLVLAGHTHGGQVRIPFLYKQMIPSKQGYDRGWYTKDDMNIFVTHGLGEVGLPIRLLAPPEIVVIDVLGE
jgi:predicted MPP superfamily phosphohydrolase